MRSSILRRRGARVADDLRVYRRQDVAPPAPDVEPDSDSEDEGDDLDDLDSPSPTQTAFPSGISTTASPGSTQTSTVDLGNIGTETLASTVTPTPSTNGAALSAVSPTSLDQNSQAQESDVSQSTTQSGLMSQGGVIAMGVLIGLATVVTIAFIIWKCRRRRNRSNSGATSKFKPFFLGRANHPQQPEVRAPMPTRRASRTQSETMDDLMAAAYAAENGQAWGSRPASQQSSDSLWREKQAMSGAYAPQQQQQQRQKSTSGSLYANQLLTGFWKRGGDDMPAAPGQARVPAPAPSVAGKTEMTSQSGATESTWNTWGVMQHHSKPKTNWIEKFRR